MSSGSHPIENHNLPETRVMDDKGLFIHSYALGTEEKYSASAQSLENKASNPSQTWGYMKRKTEVACMCPKVTEMKSGSSLEGG